MKESGFRRSPESMKESPLIQRSWKNSKTDTSRSRSFIPSTSQNKDNTAKTTTTKNMEIIKTTEELLSNLSGKESMRTLSEALSSNVEFGLTNPLEFRIKAKILIESLQNAIKQTEDSCMTELDKYSNGKADVFGSRAERVEAGVTYDFSECNHPRYNDILWEDCF